MKAVILTIATLACGLLLSGCQSPEMALAEAGSYAAAGNHAAAFPLYRQAAEAGSPEAQLALGKCYDFGRGVAANPAEAVRWYALAAEAGNADAQDNLATCYAEGYGVSKDLAKAFRWYSASATQGNAFAYNNLGLCYRNGEGVPTDHFKATECFMQSAMRGNANGQYNLGRSYFHGLGVPADIDEKDLERLALSQETVMQWLGGEDPLKVICRAPKIVSLVSRSGRKEK